MSALTDLIVQATDPVTALLVVILFAYIKISTDDLQDEVAQRTENIRKDVEVVRSRVSRVESAMIETDGGPEERDGS